MRGKTVVITGGTSGIGEVATAALAKMGARIVLVARNKARGDATLARLRDSAPGVAHSLHLADLLRLAEMKRVAAQMGFNVRKARSSAYVYAIIVDDVLRYVGKGRDKRLYTHLIEARRSAARCGVQTSHLYPRVHRKLVGAIRAGSDIAEIVISDGLSDRNAFRLEYQIICTFHKSRPDQLWNTIDERFIDKRFIPKEWHDPEHPLYKVARTKSV
jgi:hypothetical protein